MKDQLFAGSPFTAGDLAGLECIQTGMLTMGKFTRMFEESFARTVGAKYAVMVNSGSSANLLSLSVLKTLHPEIKTVGVPAVTWSTTLAPIVQLGLTPILLDVELDTLVLRKKQRKLDVLFNVHLLGQPCDALTGHDTCYEIEDCCEALGAQYEDGRHVGTRGDMGTFSFYFAHHLTTIEGGMVVTNADRIYEELVMQRAHGWIRDLPAERQAYYADKYPDIDARFLFPTLGYNLRPLEIQAELGLRQLKYLPEWQRARYEIAMKYRDVVSDAFLPYRCGAGRHSWFAYPLVLRTGGVEARKKLADFFKLAEVPTRPIVAGNLAAQPFMQKFGIRNMAPLDNADHVQKHGIYVPISQLMDAAAVDRVVGAIESWS